MRTLSWSVVFVVLQLSSALFADEQLDYNRDIRPILSENCFSCHGFDEKSRQADLRLDLAQSAFEDRGATTAIVPGKSESSEVWRRITSVDEDSVMPPPNSHLALDDKQKELIKRWIDQGAPYSLHWSLVAPVKSSLPLEGDISPIDAFIEARLAKEGLTPSEEASRATLIRRLSLDLLGLPPSHDEVIAFERDPSDRAYENLVDRLLSSPHFGERLALDWLDAARYADTNGFSIDGGRHMWLWRDWVIQSFNDNLPYDQFLTKQLAGDLLPNATDADRIATGFQRNNMVTHEGGTIPEENLTNYNVDRVKTFGESMLGLTLGCAQCHDHKYDPISQRDYYRLYAFFNTLSDKGLDGNGGVNPAPSIRTRTVLKTDERPSLEKQIASLKSRLSTIDDRLLSRWSADQRRKLLARGDKLTVNSIKVLKVSTPNRGAGLEVENERMVRLKDAGPMGAFDILAELPKLPNPITAIRVTVYPLDELGGGWGYGPEEPGVTAAKNRARRSQQTKVANEKKSAANEPVNQVVKKENEKSIGKLTDDKEPKPKGTFMLTAIAASVDAIPGDQVNLFDLERFRSVSANSWDPLHPPKGCLDPRNDQGWSPNLRFEGPVHLTANLDRPFSSDELRYLTVQLNFGNGRALIPQLIELQVLTGTDDGTDLPDPIVSLVLKDNDQLTEDDRQELWKYCADHSDELLAARTEVDNLQERLDSLTQVFTTMVMDMAEKPRDTFILNRGDYSQPTEKVEAGSPEVLPPFPSNAPANRLGLAQWLVSNEHPLTARVAVNRIWKILFGEGLVTTAADFGSQGSWPSHPELLDWLAVDFRESGWDTKALVKRLVMSRAYRRNSIPTAEMLEQDPENRLLARGPRFRLSAEFIRDAALKASGLLVDRVGGPSVNPYMPGDLWREVSHYGSTPATSQTFVQDHGEKLYRRSLYTYWKRTAPPPNMTAFDAPNREICTISRGNTTTPLQALVTLNDVQFVEAARVFAERILMQPMSLDEMRIEWAFRELLSREITVDERNVLMKALAREKERYAKNVDDAKKFISIGEFPSNQSLSPIDVAAWGQVVSILFNLSENFTKP